jgi:hypothetical protein
MLKLCRYTGSRSHETACETHLKSGERLTDSQPLNLLRFSILRLSNDVSKTREPYFGWLVLLRGRNADIPPDVSSCGISVAKGDDLLFGKAFGQREQRGIGAGSGRLAESRAGMKLRISEKISFPSARLARKRM